MMPVSRIFLMVECPRRDTAVSSKARMLVWLVIFFLFSQMWLSPVVRVVMVGSVYSSSVSTCSHRARSSTSPLGNSNPPLMVMLFRELSVVDLAVSSAWQRTPCSSHSGRMRASVSPPPYLTGTDGQCWWWYRQPSASVSAADGNRGSSIGSECRDEWDDIFYTTAPRVPAL